MAVTNATGNFTPPTLLRGGHVQSVLNSSALRRRMARHQANAIHGRSELRLLEGGGQIRLLGAFTKSSVRPSGTAPRMGLVILIHGWEGSSDSAYLLRLAAVLLAAGFDVFRLNMRDHGPSLHLNKTLFNATLTAEVAEAIRHIKTIYAPSACFLAGYSLGGNFALRIAADAGADLGLCATAAICPPIEPANTMRILENPRSPYQWYFFRKWRQSLLTKLAYFPDLGYRQELINCRHMADINGFFIPQHTPYQRAEDYFSSYALSGDRLRLLEVPALLIASRDDPIIPADDLAAIAKPAGLEIDLQRYGGHCGFLQNRRLESWVEKRLVDYFVKHRASERPASAR